MGYDITTVTLAPRIFLGMHARIPQATAGEGRLRLNDDFRQMMAQELDGRKSGLFGISWTRGGQDDLLYWAALPYEADSPGFPGGMWLRQHGGVYAHCLVPAYRELPRVLAYVREEWLPGRPAVEVNPHEYCIEEYPGRWRPEEPFQLYLPLRCSFLV